MRDEISAAVLFLARLIEKSENFNQDQLQDFKDRLSELLQERFENHWFPDKPDKGQGYRCIRVNGVNRRDPTLEKAANACGIKYEDMKLPFELTVWVDPNEVCCRFGESKGSFCTLASFCDKEIMDSSSGSEESSEDSMKGNSPSPLSTPTKQSLQMSVREKSGGGLVRIRSSRAGDAVKLGGNNNGRGRRGYYQYHHHHHHHHHHQNQHNQPWYSLISPPWMGGQQQQQHHNNGNNNNNSNISSSTLTSTITSTTSSTSPVTSTTHNNVVNGGGGGGTQMTAATTQYHNNNIRTRWPSSTTTTTSSANHYYFHHNHHNHNRYESSTSQKSALKV